jgi:hypothetical protein
MISKEKNMNKHLLVALSVFGFVLSAVSAPSLAKDADKRSIEIDDYFALQYVGSPVVSPDGQWIAYTVSGQNLEKDNRSSRVWMISTAGGEPHQFTTNVWWACCPRCTRFGNHFFLFA